MKLKTLLLASFFLLVLSILVSNALADGCVISVDDIRFIRSDSVDPVRFCRGDRIAVHAHIYVSTDTWLDVDLYVNGEHYDSEKFHAARGSNVVSFSRLIYASDYYVDLDPEVRVVAWTDCGSDERIEHLYISDCGRVPEYNLRVRVRDCSTGRSIEDAEVHVISRYYDPTEYTDSSGYAKFDLPADTYTVTASRRGYTSKSQRADVYSDQTTYIRICLREKECTPKYLDGRMCFGPYVRQRYQGKDCTERWKFVEYCAYGCSGGECLPPIVKAETQPTTTTTTTQPVQPIVVQPCDALYVVFGITSVVALLLALFVLLAFFRIRKGRGAEGFLSLLSI